MRVLLVEDDEALAQALRSSLKNQSFIVEWASSLAAARASLRLVQWAAVLLDLHLPDGDGLSLVPELRRHHKEASIIIMTARDQISDRIRGLDAGADDYLVKPFDLDELLARLRAIERRRGDAVETVLRNGDLEIDFARNLVRRNGVPLELTAKEWGLLRVLAGRPDRIHTRANLVEALYGFDDLTESNTLEVFVSALRKKLGRERILTMRGLGYRFNLACDGVP